MAIPSAPVNFYAQQANRQVWLQWDISVGATSYSVQRSLDGVNYTTYATVVVNNYLDTVVTVGTQYWYQIASINGSGTSGYTEPQSVVPTPTAEMSLGQIRLMSQQKADMVGNDFITLPEWNSFINLAMYELYDELIGVDEGYFVATPVQFTTVGAQYLYPLPDGVITYTNGISGTGTLVGDPFYKLMGVDLGVNATQGAFATLNKFMFHDRNKYLYPNSTSTLYGVLNLQYRIVGNNLEFIPIPSASQYIRIWYIPRLPQLLKDTDLTTVSISGWIAYVIARAAKYAMDKQQLDSSKLDQEIVFLKDRITSSAVNRDIGQPDTVSDTRQSNYWGSGSGFNGPTGGY